MNQLRERYEAQKARRRDALRAMARAREEERAREAAAQSQQISQSAVEKKMIDESDMENDFEDDLGEKEEEPKGHFLRNSRIPRVPVSRLGRWTSFSQ